MTYSKPQVAVLGEAVDLIQGQKISSLEVNGRPKLPADCEFDD